MANILKTKSIYYNDCVLIPKIGKVLSRRDVPLEKWRFITAAMPSLCGKIFAKEASNNGLTVCLHRFCKPEQQLDIYNSLDIKDNVYMSCGLKNDGERYIMIKKSGCKNVMVDFANGYMPMVYENLCNIQNIIGIENLIIGNVNTKEGIIYLRDLTEKIGFNKVILRVGIGGGNPCSSSDICSVNRGNITELMECSEEARLGNSCFCAADGGISKSDYACKAFAAGSDYLIMGKFWMQCLEAESNINGDGSYYGCASYTNQINHYGKKLTHSEGKLIPRDESIKLRPFKEVLDELWGGISSFVSYNGTATLTESIGSGTFEIKINSLPPKNR